MATIASNNQLFRVYMEASEIVQQGVMWLDQDGNILYVNSQFARELGYDRENFGNKTIFQVNPHTTLMRWRQLWSELTEAKQITLETEHITAKDTIYPVKLKGILIDVDGEKVCCGIVENLMESNRYLQLLKLAEDAARTGSWEWDLVKEEVLFTEGMFRLLEIPEKERLAPEEIIEIKKKLLSEREYEALRSQLREAVKTGEYLETEINVFLPSQEKSQRFNLLAKPLFKDGFTYKVVGLLQDFSNVAGRTEELYLMQFGIEHAYSMIYWVNKDGSFKYINKAICHKLGYSEKELLEMNLLDIKTDLTPEKWRQQWQELKEKKTIEIERAYRTKAGKKIPVQISLNYINFGGREFCLEFARDLTIKKDRDQIIRLSYHTLNQAKELIYWLDEKGNFVYFNNSFCEKLGYQRSEIKKLNILDFFPQITKQQFQETWTAMQQGEVITNESEIKGKDGSTFPVETNVSLVNFEGKEIASVILRDITIRKKKEKELKERLAEIESLRRQLEEENIILKEEIKLDRNFGSIISKSPRYKPVLQKVDQVADTDATVLITGETGTGKELLAKAIHQLSNRSDRPLIKVNCGALPENLIESELFGHEKGAFTGAFQRKIGRFETAHQATIFLDEIGELPLDLQVKLLRVLQEKEFERVGGNETIQVDVRVIAATNRNLEKLVQEGKFRPDLFYRLNVFPIENIPLREHMDDLPLLVRHFMDKYNKQLGKSVKEIPQHILQELMQYDFPGNVRELENIIERGMILTKGEKLQLDFSFKKTLIGEEKTFRTMQEMQREHILEALKRTQGRVSGPHGAAKLLGMNDKTLTSRMQKLGINRMDYLS